MSNKIQLIWVDVFTTQAFSGNPCAVYFIEGRDFPQESWMQAMAHEMNLSETAYVMGDLDSGFYARYFTPDKEIPLAGHPTLASVRALLELGLISEKNLPLSFSLTLKTKTIKIDVGKDESNQIVITMHQPAPEYLEKVPLDLVCPSAGILSEQVLAGYEAQIVSTGTPMLMLPVASEDVLAQIRLHPAHYSDLEAKFSFFSLHIFYWDPVKQRTLARHIGSGAEDSFTGSATGCMAAWLWSQKLIEPGVKYTALQGQHMGRPGVGYFEVLADNHKCTGVNLSGYTKVLLSGELKDNPYKNGVPA